MSHDSRKKSLARIRGLSSGLDAQTIAQELARLGAAPVAQPLDPDPIVCFMANVLRNQGSLALAADRREVVKAIGKYLYRHLRNNRLVAGNDPHLAALPWREGGVLPRFGEIENGEKAALSYAHWGIAETGATVLGSGKHNPPANQLLPEHHIVLLEFEGIIPDLEAFWRAEPLRRGERPRGISFIAGPSSTGDIEAQLVYGAHGPKAWHVILLGKAPPGALERARQLAGVPGDGDEAAL